MKKTLKMLSFLTCLVLSLTAVFCAVAEDRPVCRARFSG